MGQLEIRETIYDNDDFCLRDKQIDGKVVWGPMICTKYHTVELTVHVLSE